MIVDILNTNTATHRHTQAHRHTDTNTDTDTDTDTHRHRDTQTLKVEATFEPALPPIPPTPRIPVLLLRVGVCVREEGGHGGGRVGRGVGGD